MKEFFEAFGIDKQNYCGDKTHNEDGKYKGTVCNGDCPKCYFTVLNYPSITSDIVLGLIQILIDNGQKLKIFEASEMFKDHTKYIINAENEIRHDIYGTGSTLNNAILSLFIRFPHLSDQVRELFNAR